MPDRLLPLLLRLYPEEFRTRYGPQIEADLYHPDTNRVFAVADIAVSALRHRLKSPGPYIWLAALTLAAATVGLSSSITLKHTYRLLQPRFGTNAELYALLFFAVFLVLSSVMLLSIHWLQKCSKSKA